MITTDNITQNNEQFWLEMTKQSTLKYCHEMLKLSIEFQKVRNIDLDYQDHLKSIDDKILAYMDKAYECNKQQRWHEITPKDSPFPKDLYGCIHEKYIDNDDSGSFRPNHLMCKLAVLRDDVNKLHYEFLIEYNIFETDVEIYFGVKAVSDSWDTTPEFQQTVINQWKEVKGQGTYKRSEHRFKITNNGNNGTFWPFWWRMSMDCKEELLDSIQITKKFYNDYKKFLNLTDVIHPKFKIIERELANSLLSEKDYGDLIKQLSTDFGEEFIVAFNRVINQCVKKGIIKRYNGKGIKYFCNGPTIKIVCILRVFFQAASLYNSDWHNNRTPIEALSKVILDKHGRIINQANWRKHIEQLEDRYSDSIRFLKELFPDIKWIQEYPG